ncbi:hypothetical protein ACOSQ2_015127 [Xanthoceras sorbifolium]
MGRASSSDQGRGDLEAMLKVLTSERMEKSKVDIGHYRPLMRAILEKKDLKSREDLLKKNPTAATAELDEFGNTIFHLIVQESVNKETIMLLEQLVSEASQETLEIQNVSGLTALDIAASAGNTKAVQLFLNKNKSLLAKEIVEETEILLPVHHAALWCRKETVEYLLSVMSTDDDQDLSGNPADYALLLKMLIESNLHGIALGLLKKYPELAYPDQNYLWNVIVNTLAGKYLAFASGKKLGFWQRLIYRYIPVKDRLQDNHVAPQPLQVGSKEDRDVENQIHYSCSSDQIPILPHIAAAFGALDRKLYIVMWNALCYLVPSIKHIHDQKLMHAHALAIVRDMISKVNWTYKEAVERLKEPVLTAARLGIHEFVDEVLKAYPNSVLFYDKNGRNIFLLAVLHRKEEVFRLIHDQVASLRDYNNYVRDNKEHNILHLAGKLVPSGQVPGAALQMQRELQWFKGIRDLFIPSLQEQRNYANKIPKEVFTRKHRKLVESGEKGMRDTATSCSVVAALIITIVFAAAFTVPGGIDTQGIANYLNRTYFRIFAISVALALFSSTTSVQMFLGMLTSRYAEEDFFEALPRKMIIGLMTLFLSSTSMMVAFGAAFCIVLSHPWKWAIILICLLGSLPVTLFALMQFPLLVDICKSTYGSNILKPKT